MKKAFLTFAIVFLSVSFSKAQTPILFYTTMGDFIVEMSDSLTPITSGNCISLVDTQFYDGITFHRVIDDFVVQGGDPPGAATGPGYTIQDEFDSTGTLSNVQKTISMANTGQPNSGGSQFFVNLVDNTFLDFDKAPLSSKHPVFGMVIHGWEVVDSIGNVEVYAGSNRPKTDVVMDSVRIFDPNDTIPVDTTPPLTNSQQRQHVLKASIFPNPIIDNSVVIVESHAAGTAHLNIIDQLGRTIHAKQIVLRDGMNRFTQLGGNEKPLSPGVYHLTIDFGQERLTKKFAVGF